MFQSFNFLMLWFVQISDGKTKVMNLERKAKERNDKYRYE